MNFKLALILLLTSLATAFIAQNLLPIDVEFFYWKTSISRAMLVFLTLLIGFVLGWFLNEFMTFRKASKRTYLP